MLIDVLSFPNWRLTHPGGYVTTSSAPSRIPTTSRPDQVTSGVIAAGDGVIPCGLGGEFSPQSIQLLPFSIASGPANRTGAMQIIGWRSTKLGLGQALWIPVSVATVSLTFNVVGGGVTGSDIPTARFATTPLVTGPQFENSATTAPWMKDWANIPVSVSTTAPAIVTVGTLGFRFIEVALVATGATTSINCLWSFFS